MKDILTQDLDRKLVLKIFCDRLGTWNTILKASTENREKERNDAGTLDKKAHLCKK